MFLGVFSEAEEPVSLPCMQAGWTGCFNVEAGVSEVGDAVLPWSPASCPEASTLWPCCWSGLVVSGSQLISKGEKQLKIYPMRRVGFSAH